jgi:hypothetical protein
MSPLGSFFAASSKRVAPMYRFAALSMGHISLFSLNPITYPIFSLEIYVGREERQLHDACGTGF